MISKKVSRAAIEGIVACPAAATAANLAVSTLELPVVGRDVRLRERLLEHVCVVGVADLPATCGDDVAYAAEALVSLSQTAEGMECRSKRLGEKPWGTCVLMPSKLESPPSSTCGRNERALIPLVDGPKEP